MNELLCFLNSIDYKQVQIGDIIIELPIKIADFILDYDPLVTLRGK
jgi:hypothetical protein